MSGFNQHPIPGYVNPVQPQAQGAYSTPTHPGQPHAGPSQQPLGQPRLGTTPSFSSPQHPGFSSSPNTGAPSPYSDPASLLRIIPLTNYAPTARVAGHMAPHTTAYPTPPSSTPGHIYPQYTQAFDSMDQPRSQQDWDMRHRAQDRMGQMLQASGPSYGGRSQLYNDPFQAFATPPTHTAPPMPHAFLPNLFPYQRPDLPPTPTSMRDTPPRSASQVSEQDYFEQLVSGALARGQVDSSSINEQAGSMAPPTEEQTRMRRESSTPSVNGTPTISRTMSRQFSRVAIQTESPDPLSLPGPSPSKKQKLPKYTNGIRQTSPTGGMGSGATGTSRKALAPATPTTGRGPTVTPSPSRSRVVVEIPIRRRSSVSSVATSGMQVDQDQDSPDELWGDDGDRDDDGDWTSSRKAFRSPSPGIHGAQPASRIGSKSVRTGEKDLRTTYQKFTSLLEDVFEASDALPAEPTPEDLARSRFFDRMNKDASLPLLSSEAVERITRYITRIHSGRRARPGVAKEQTWDEDMLKNLFRHLERIMREGEGVLPFPSDRKAMAQDKDEKGKSKKKGKKSKGSGSKSPELDSQETNGTEGEVIDEETEQKGEAALKAISAAAGAAECCLAVLDGEGLSKPLYSEDLLSLAVSLLRSQMNNAIFPTVEGMAGEKISCRYLSHLVQVEVSAKQSKSLKLSPFFKHPSLSAIAQATTAALPHLSSLISRTDMSFSDSLVIQTVYLAITPLFISEPVSRQKEGKAGAGKVGWGVMKSMRVEALGCLRGAFAKYNDQRQWITEEILTSLVKLPNQKAQSEFLMANGTKMSTITALLLQLIQASALSTTSRIKRIRQSAVEVESGGKPGAQEEAASSEKRIYTEVTESCFRSTSAVAGYLLQRCGQSKATKSTLDADFKTILDNFVNDLLKSLYRPEWPAAALYLNVFSKMFIAALEDQATSAEATAIKNIALDHLGAIGAKLRQVAVDGKEDDPKGLVSLDQTIASPDVPSPTPLIEAHDTVHAYLASASREDSMFASARDLSLVSWATELQGAIDKTQSVLPKLFTEKTEESVAIKDRLEALLPVLTDALGKAWEGNEDVFGIDQPNQASSANSANIAICRHRPLQSAFDTILRAIVSGMDMSAVALRTRALKALSLIAAVDADILAQPSVRAAFENRLGDASPAVRDAAVDLVGKYVVLKPELAVDYYPQIALRTSDMGLAVRKKVIKLLKEIFPMTQTQAIRVDICCKMVDMIGDADDNIKDMAIKGLIDLLFSSSHLISATLLVDIVGQYRSSTAPIEKALEEIATVDAASAAGRTVAIVDALVQRLVDATEQVDFDSVSHIRAISLLCASKADLIDPQKAAVLLNYLRPPANSDEQASNELLLRIFRLSIPAMPRTASSFANELTAKLKPMMSKPSGGYPVVKETIGCYCAIVNHLTKDYKGLMGILRACLGGMIRSRAALAKAASAPSQTRSQITQALGLTMYIAALIGENCNLDQVAMEDEAVQAELDKFVKGPRLYEYLYDTFREYASMDIPQQSPILSLGCLFRTYPDLVIMEETGEWMDGVFASNDQDNHARLLVVMQDFLESEAKKRAEHAGQSRDITALIGSTAELSDAGTSTTMVQRNFEHILAGAKSNHFPTQTAALDVLAFTVNQGLYHPLQCLPILVSLETSSDPYLSDRALGLHAALHQKHSTLVNVRYLDYVKASYEYQRTLSSEPSGHREGTALLAGWFTMLGEKRQYRLDFIKALGRVFEYDAAKSTEYDVGLALYVAENLTCFEYRLQEEVMLAIQHLSTSISTCTPLLQTLERADFGVMDDMTSLEGLSVGISEEGEDGEEAPAQPMINASMIVCIALLAKNHLLACYGLSEDKCLKQNTAKKTALGDKAAIRRNAAVLEVGRIPLVRAVETVRDFKEQQANFFQLLQEDGTVEMDD